MKFIKITLILLSFLTLNTVFAQRDSTFAHHNDAIKDFKDLSSFPMFPNTDCNGDKNCANRRLFQYMFKELKYPSTALKNKVEGKVIVGFVVDKNGKIRDTEIYKSVSEELDAEALRVINSMPNWIPGVNKGGYKVDVYLKLPISFVLPRQAGIGERRK